MVSRRLEIDLFVASANTRYSQLARTHIHGSIFIYLYERMQSMRIS
jgi:hypothetical protein